VGSSDEMNSCRMQWDSSLSSDPTVLWTPATMGLGPGYDMNQEEHRNEEVLMGPRMRIDYALQEHLVEGYVESYALLQSHFCYWTSHDVALFMLKKLLREVADQSHTEEVCGVPTAAKKGAQTIAAEQGDHPSTSAW